MPVGRWKSFVRWSATRRGARDTQRPTKRLRVRLRELAEERRRWGYRRLHILLKREGWKVNSKRVYRIYVEEKLVVRRRRRRRRICAQARALLTAPSRVNETWTMDFLHDALASGRKLRTLSIEDAYTREMLAIEVDTPLPALRVIRVLERQRLERDLRERMVIDHDTEFTSKALDQWAYEHKVRVHFITPGRPMENGYIESFYGKFREECLNEHWFRTLNDARRPSKTGGSNTTWFHTTPPLYVVENRLWC